MDGGENSVGIDSRAATAGVSGEVTAGGVFIGLNCRSARRPMDEPRNAYLLETQEVGCLGIVPRNNLGPTKLLSEGGTFP